MKTTCKCGLSIIECLQAREIGISIVDLDAQTVVFEDGTTLPIAHYMNESGDVVDDWDECFVYCFGSPEIGYGQAIKSWLEPEAGSTIH